MMPQDFEKTGGNPPEIEPLLTAYYNRGTSAEDRAEQLWRRLEPNLSARKSKPNLFGHWFGNLKMKWSTNMKNETPLLDRDETGFEPERNHRVSRIGSLLGGLATLVLVIGLVAIFGLNAGKGPSGQPGAGVGAQPVATNTALPSTPTPKPAESKTPASTVATNPTPTPVPFDSRTPTASSTNGIPTPTAAANTSNTPVDTTSFKFDIADVSATGLMFLDVNYDYSTLPEIYQSTKPQIRFYASKNPPVFIEQNLKAGLDDAGYTATDPFVSAASNGGKIPPGGVFIYAKKAGQPDLFINLVSIANETEISKLSQGGFFLGGKDFVTQANNIRLKGYPYLVMVLSGDNLLKTINGGTDIFTGEPKPSFSPTPVK